MGRALKFKSVEELERKIEDYFNSCYTEREVTVGKGKNKRVEIVKELVRPLTITGLALALDTTRETLLDYEEKEDYSYTIKKAKLRIENFTEECLFTSKNTAGVIFNLKNNYKRWVDKQEVETTGETTVNNKIDFSNLSTDQIRELLKDED